MPSGRRDARRSQRDDKWRLRFYGINNDQLVLIDLALEKARNEMNTAFDAVALEALCIHYLLFSVPGPSGVQDES